MKIANYMKTAGITLALAGIATFKTPVYSQQMSVPDSFERVVTPSGSTDTKVLSFAPNPEIEINGVKRNAVIVVDLSRNILYKYDNDGMPEKAYLVASGKKSTPTEKGVRIVTHIEKYPYRNASYRSKRRRNPRAYGPNIICLDKINPENGKRSVTGEFIHGNNNSSILGEYVSHGCIRMDNEVIQELAQTVKRNDIIIIQ